MEEKQDQKIADLEAKLEQYEKFMKDNEWDSIEEMQKTLNECEKKYFDMKQQLAEKDKNNLILYSMLYETLEKQGCENVASQIDQMTGFTLDKQAEWFKGNRNCDELLKLLAEKEKEIKLLNAMVSTLPAHDEELEDMHNQAKTDFAIEKLEKVKEFFLEEHRDEEMDTDYIITKDAGQIADYLLDQIKELKEGQDV